MLSKSNLAILSTIVLLLLSSCASKKLRVKDADFKVVPAPTENIRHTVYLIGDAGNSAPTEMSAGLKALKKEIGGASENSTLIFLGDNNYPGGIPPKAEKELRKAGINHLDRQLEAIEDYKGRPIFIPGNHDWRTYGKKGVRRQEKYIEKKLNAGIEDKDDWQNYFLPDDGCPGPEVIEVNDQLSIVIIDTQWWLLDWDKEPEINDGCAMKNRFAFNFYFEETLRKNRNKNVIIALHHPMYTYGTHGGATTLNEHLFPLTQFNKNLKIPVPVVGSIAAGYRKFIGSRQDVSNATYRNMRNKLVGAAKKNGRFIFASGHDHNLQHIENNDQIHVVSGSGSKESPVTLGGDAEMVYGKQGFSKIDFYEDGSAWISYYAAEKDGIISKLIFTKKIKGPLEISEANIPETFPNYNNGIETVNTEILNYEVKPKGKIHNALLGEHYRDIYIPKYDFPVLDLSTFHGGATVLKRGGGNQTNSLRLLDSEGHQWAMRSMTKDASRFIPYPFNKISATQSLVEDNFLSTHPFAPLAAAKLADAVDVLHANPKIYYIPKQPALGVHNDIFGDGVYLVEERAAKNWENNPSLNYAKKFISTPDLIDELEEDYKHQVDQKSVIQAHLLDVVIGDWDRHDDQWRWAVFKEGKGKRRYQPVPRDRDQPFSKYDGAVTAVARQLQPFLKQLQVYKKEVKSPKWSAWGGRLFNQTFMTELTWEDWQTAIKNTQKKLTLDVIEEAFATWPKYAYDNSAAEIKEILLHRLKTLEEISRRDYLLLNKDVNVVGTEERERFIVQRLDDERTQVQVYHINKKGEQKSKFYDRIFLRSETKTIHLLGLSGKDEFLISGEVQKGIRLRVIGGLDHDLIQDNSKVKSGGKKTLVYDYPTGNTFELGPESKDKTSTRPQINIYNRRDPQYEYDFTIPFPVIGFNIDDGVKLGLKLQQTKYKFKKDPYGQMHIFEGSISTATAGFDLGYEGTFVKALGPFDAILDAEIHNFRYVNNFFGLGNNTIQTNDDLDFYRLRKADGLFNPKLGLSFAARQGLFSFGPIVEYTKVQKTDGRFIARDDLSLPSFTFDDQIFAGFNTEFKFLNVDDKSNPKSGIKFNAVWNYKRQLKESLNSQFLASDLSLYFSLTTKKNIILATRVGFEMAMGDYQFFQGARLGGRSNFRGVRVDRFTGQSSFFHNTDLRIKLASVNNNLLPFTLGLHGGFDYGRVGLDSENNNDQLHTAYGGGIWIAPLDFLLLSTDYFVSDVDDIFSVRLGFSF